MNITEKQIEFMLSKMNIKDVTKVKVQIGKNGIIYVNLYHNEEIICSADLDYVLKTRCGFVE